jgi:hypothetical protein
MRVLRVLLGSVLWLLAGVLGLLGVVLSVTILLMPIGVPLLMLARRLFQKAMGLIMPRAVSHPIQETDKALRGTNFFGRSRGAPDVGKARSKASRKARKKGKRLTKQGQKMVKKGKKLAA